MDRSVEPMHVRWRSFASSLNAAADADALFTIIASLYTNPPRPYHNLTHIHACLKLLEDAAKARPPKKKRPPKSSEPSE